MPYGVDEDLWRRLPAADRASIKQSWQAAGASPSAPSRAATPTPARPGAATSHPVQPKAAPGPAAQARKAATPVTPAYLHALTSAGDITGAQIPTVVAAAQQKGLASPAAIAEARHASQLTAPPRTDRPAHVPQAPSLTPPTTTSRTLAPGTSQPRKGSTVAGVAGRSSVTDRRIAEAYHFFMAKGLTSAQAAGLVGNLQYESGGHLNPAERQIGGGPGRGIAQWTVGSSRWQGLLDLARHEHVRASSFRVQLEYVWQELRTTHSAALSALKETRTVAEAAVVFEKTYEAAGVPALSARITFADDVYSRFNQ